MFTQTFGPFNRFQIYLHKSNRALLDGAAFYFVTDAENMDGGVPATIRQIPATDSVSVDAIKSEVLASLNA